MIADEVQRDLYGYTRHEVDETRPAPVVVPVRFTDEAAAYDGFLRALGLTGTPEPGGYTTYVAPDGGGEVGVHYVYSDDLPVVTERARRGPLDVRDHRRARRAAAGAGGKGFALTRFDEDFGSFIDITDPDGQSVQVHQR